MPAQPALQAAQQSGPLAPDDKLETAAFTAPAITAMPDVPALTASVHALEIGTQNNQEPLPGIAEEPLAKG